MRSTRCPSLKTCVCVLATRAQEPGPEIEHRGLSGVVGGGIDVETARGAPRRPVVGWLQLL